MSFFIESICFQHGEYQLLDRHQERLSKTFVKYYPAAEPFKLEAILPACKSKMRQKVRLVYDNKTYQMTSEVYQVKPISKIRLIEHHEISYEYKFENRDELKSLYNRKEEADDILIIKNGLVTDSYYANPAFWDGKEWLVPNSYLLNGVKRQYLLATNKVREIEIRKEDITSFEKVSLINAMLDLDETSLKIENILS